jgi:hypothetical protein
MPEDGAVASGNDGRLTPDAVYAIAGAFAAGMQAGQGCAIDEAAAARSAAAWARMPRSELWQEPHWSPIPQRWRSRTELAPFSMARATSFSDFPRQMQMITFVRSRSLY